MEALVSLGRTVRRALEPPLRGDDERLHVARNLRLSLRAGIVGAVLGAAASLASGRSSTAGPLGVLAGLLLLALWLLRRGRLLAATILALGSMVGAVHVMLVVGQGIHDRAALLYPVVVLMAAVVLDARVLLATTALCTLSAVVVVRLEDSGALPTAFTGRLGWLPIADIAIILAVTGVAVHVLVADVVRGMIEARGRGASLAAANSELAARGAELERFTYVVSHDLRSPLITIGGFLDYVERDAREGNTARIAADVERIRAATVRMGRLLDDLLELSRTGRIDRPHQDVALIDAVREARGLVEGRLAGRGVCVEVEEPLPAVHADPQRLVELLQNLIENAAKFMGDRADPRIRVGGRTRDGGEVVVFVRDNGIGIEPALQQRVFELFHRLDPRQEGTGLGLALARKIVESHRGRIWVESEGAGRGSTFFFTLPGARGGPAA